MKSTREEIIKVIASVANVETKDLDSGIVSIEELDLDSLQLYELIIDIEEKYSIRLSDEAIDAVVTVDDFIELVESFVNKK
ncbi:MAG: acyl carrier protein [Clostridia bacterium]|nr:acyl carrier protein [Clostridia bacterium]